jgi:hypothetical protein
VDSAALGGRIIAIVGGLVGIIALLIDVIPLSIRVLIVAVAGTAFAIGLVLVLVPHQASQTGVNGLPSPATSAS